MALNNTLEQMHLMGIYGIFHTKEADYMFFSKAPGTFSKTEHMVGHKSSLNKFKKI